MRVDVFSRAPEGAWGLRAASEPTALVELPSVGCSISLAEIYQDVSFAGPEIS